MQTAKAGLFGFAGHDHRIRARSASGWVVYYPARPEDSRVEVLVPAESLEVLTPPDTAEIRKVTDAMRRETLQVDAYPGISFVSTAVAPRDDSLLVRGRLTLVGQTREIAVALRVTFQGDTLLATGSVQVKQSDFGITPYRGGPAGTVRVADLVRIDIAVVAVRETGRR